jgi:3-isopropylmalate/(R)-2-methylmalate dehydratase large subunit
MAEILALKGRVLFLSEDPALIEAQLAGRELSRAEGGKLRDDVSNDEFLKSLLGSRS